MATKLYDLVVVTGSYTGRDGKQRNNYKNIGSVMQNDKGAKFLMMDATFNPAGVTRQEGSSSIVVWLNTPKDNKQQEQSFSQKPSTPPEDWDVPDDTIPW